MRYIFLILIVFFITGCKETTYEINILYQDGSKELVRANSLGYPSLSDGCIYFGSSDAEAIRCGVKSFTYKTIQDGTKKLY